MMKFLVVTSLLPPLFPPCILIPFPPSFIGRNHPPAESFFIYIYIYIDASHTGMPWMTGEYWGINVPNNRTGVSSAAIMVPKRYWCLPINPINRFICSNLAVRVRLIQRYRFLGFTMKDAMIRSYPSWRIDRYPFDYLAIMHVIRLKFKLSRCCASKK